MHIHMYICTCVHVQLYKTRYIHIHSSTRQSFMTTSKHQKKSIKTKSCHKLQEKLYNSWKHVKHMSKRMNILQQTTWKSEEQTHEKNEHHEKPWRKTKTNEKYQKLWKPWKCTSTCMYAYVYIYMNYKGICNFVYTYVYNIVYRIVYKIVDHVYIYTHFSCVCIQTCMYTYMYIHVSQDFPSFWMILHDVHKF